MSAEELRRLIEDLGHPQFKVREEASRRLKQLGPAAEAALKEAAGSATAEVRARAKALLAARTIPAENLARRAVRAVGVLERIGTPEARSVLEALARGGGCS